MKYCVQELQGPSLDWAVAKCELPQGWPDAEIVLGDETDYSTDWAQGGPIIERERIGVKYTGAAMGFVAWINGELSTKNDHYGLTPLIAAMRCYVASRLGDEIEIPAELSGV